MCAYVSSMSNATTFIRMSIAPVVNQAIVKVSNVATLIATKNEDFGGYTGPILGLLVIGVIIAVLTPPVKE